METAAPDADRGRGHNFFMYNESGGRTVEVSVAATNEKSKAARSFGRAAPSGRPTLAG